MKNTNKKNMMRTFFIVGIIAVLFYSFIESVSAVGVAAGVSAKIPLEVYPGEERVVLLTLQNTDVEGNAVVEGKILEGSNIASLDKSKYTVPFKQLTPAYLQIKVPENANLNDIYTVRYEFNHVGIEGDIEGTGASFSQGVVRSFNVNVIEKPAETEKVPPVAETSAGTNALWWVLLAVVIIVLIAWWAIMKAKKNNAQAITPKKK